ncbi:MAG: tRNA guanosine(34) transglycosylase Tgt [Candidatus Magasanikbacteria bacterium]
MFFEVIHKDKNSNARTGILHTAHGNIETPEFMPVGTQGTVKSLDVQDLDTLGAQIILGNTYHLHLRPGENLISNFGGLHDFMGWNRPILTDSGGFQVFSLKHKNIKTFPPVEDRPLAEKHMDKNLSSVQGSLVNIDNDGVSFRSYIDGSEHRFTPEKAIEIQHKIGADIIMAFDECTPDDANEKYAKRALARTHAWAKRCLIYHKNNTKNQFLFGIIQGAKHKELREKSAKVISSMDFDGIAIGGESIGYNMEATKKILDWVVPIIPKDKPIYTMGLGFSPFDLFEVVEKGVDMFDCVAPTRIARNGTLYISPEQGGCKKNKYRLNILNAAHRTDKNSIDSTCTCFTCKNHSRAYLHHLFKSNELLAYRLATLHNLHFFLSLMKQMREAIREDQFPGLKKSWAN